LFPSLVLLPLCGSLWAPVCSVAKFMESRGNIEDALRIATDPDYKFELAVQLNKLDIAKVRGPYTQTSFTPMSATSAISCTFGISCTSEISCTFGISCTFWTSYNWDILYTWVSFGVCAGNRGGGAEREQVEAAWGPCALCRTGTSHFTRIARPQARSHSGLSL